MRANPLRRAVTSAAASMTLRGFSHSPRPHDTWRKSMAAKFDLTDDTVVVIIGSGAGGGTLANELAQRGIKVVILEAGARIENQDFINDEWESFSQLAWSDMRTTSGSWQVSKDFPNLPAWIVK